MLRNHLARLNADGTLDGLYNVGTNLNDAVNSVALLPDGKVVIGGAFTLVGGGARNRVARLLANGTLDAAFDPGSGPDAAVAAVAVRTDGKLLLAGAFTNFNGTARPGLARVNADGSLDATFAAVGGVGGNVAALAWQPDGKALLAGTFTQVGGVARGGVARLNADGSLDTGFNPGTGANDSVQSHRPATRR